MRIYPPNVRPFEGEPLGEHFEVRELSPAIGRGVIAKRGFVEGEQVSRFTGEILDHITLYTIQLDTQRHLHDPYFTGKLLHSCEPNCRIELGRWALRATRPIAPGDVLTIDYDETEDTLFRAFECSCGASSCRGSIKGRFGRSEAEGREGDAEPEPGERPWRS